MTTAESEIRTKSREIRLKSRPDCVPTEECFEEAEASITPLEEGQVLVENLWMSVDPYMRGRMKQGDSYVEPFAIGEPLEGGCVGRVIESRSPNLSEGDHVLANYGWRERWKASGEDLTRIDGERAPLQSYLGVLGMTGMTAWVGLTKIVKLESGMTVFVSAASGAVGSVACQIAKARGCRVVGSAGSDRKTKWLREVAGVDATINYKRAKSVAEELGEAAPNGIDVYFDNVGGDHLEAAIENLNDFGRIVACGMISTYNATDPPAAPRNLFKIIAKRIRLEGFIVRDHMDDRETFVDEMASLIEADRVRWEETVTEGLPNAPEAFIGLFEGENLGKALVRLDQE